MQDSYHSSLTKGVVSLIVGKDQHIPNPILQITSISIVTEKERYKLFVSDGDHYCTAMVTTSLNNILKEGHISTHYIVRLTDYVLHNLSSRRIIIILNLELVQPFHSIIGNPLPYDNNPQQQQQQQQQFSTQVQNPPQQPQQGLQIQTQNPPSTQTSQKHSGGQITTPDGQIIYPISSLNPYQTRWVIKARVTYKSPINHYLNARGEGKLFSVDLVDPSGEIQCTMFNDGVDLFYPVFEVGLVFFISKGTVKCHQGPKFTSIDNDFELTLGSGSGVVLCLEDAPEIPRNYFCFRMVADIAGLVVGEVVDVLAIPTQISEVVEVTSKRDSNVLYKRSITLTDDSNCSIDLTLWGENAQNFDVLGSPVIAFKNVKVTDFSGKSLTAVRLTRWDINPDIPRAHQLRTWFELKNPIETNLQNLSKNFGGGINGITIKTLMEGQAMGFEKPSFFMAQGTITNIKHDINTPIYYTACPQEGCNKKVIQHEPTNTWHCSKCNKSYPNFSARYILSLLVADFSGNVWVTVFNDAGNVLLGRDACEIKRMRDNEDPTLESVFKRATFNRFNLKIKANLETYQDTERVKLTVVSAEPINYIRECHTLIQKIKLTHL